MSVKTNERPSKTTGVGRLVRRLDRERRRWTHPGEGEIPTEMAWRAGVAEGLRLAQVAIRKAVGHGGEPGPPARQASGGSPIGGAVRRVLAGPAGGRQRPGRSPAGGEERQ